MSRLGDLVLRRKPSDFGQPRIGKTVTLSAESAVDYLSLFASAKRDELYKKWCSWNVYDQGGPAAAAIDIHVTSIFTNGWKLISDDKNLADEVHDRLDELNWEMNARMAVRDGYMYRWGIHEIVGTVDDNGAPDGGWALVTRCSRDFSTKCDQYGNIGAYEQYINPMGVQRGPSNPMLTKPIVLEPNNAIQITPIPTADGKGVSIIERAWKQIDWYNQVNQASADAIWRHGHPKWNVKMDLDGGIAPADVVAGMESPTTDLNALSEMITNKAMVDIQELDKGGVPNVQMYGDWALQQLAASMTIPESFFGLGHRSNEATASVVLRAFYDGKATEQFAIASQYQSSLIDDLILEDLGANPGDVKLVFNNPNPANDLSKAQALAAMVGINLTNPEWLMTQAQQQEYMGITPVDENQQPQQPKPIQLPQGVLNPAIPKR